MRKFCQIAVLFLVAALLNISGNARAWKYGYSIDVSAMKALEEASAFPVRVVKKAVMEEAYDVTEYNEPGDALIFRVRNNSGGEISGFRLFFVAYDDEGKTKEIDSREVFSFGTEEGAPQIYSLTAEDEAIPDNSEIEFGQAVHWKRFSGVRAIIASYTTAEGEVVDNPDFAVWRNLAAGHSSSDTELD